MAGFFGLFNYDKVGPGISKNAPKKWQSTEDCHFTAMSYLCPFA